LNLLYTGIQYDAMHNTLAYEFYLIASLRSQ